MKYYYPRKKNHRNNNYNNNYNNNNSYFRQNKYDKSYNSIEKISEQIFRPNDKFLLDSVSQDTPKIENLNKDALPYYPLPTNEGYELFLKVTKKDMYKKTQYSLPFMLSLRDKFKERPPDMKEIKIPQKNEIRSRAKVVTEEAYRVTRNYLDEYSDKRNFSIAYVRKNELSDNELKNKIMILREMLNKICYDNYDDLLNEILKFDYDEKLLESFKNLIITKILTEKEFFILYVNICAQMCKLYNKKTYSNDQKMNFKNLLLVSIQKEFLNPNETSISYPFSYNQDNVSKKKFIKNIKYANIRLISEFYLIGLIPKKIIKDCIDELIQNKNDFSISLLCQLIITTAKKLYTDAKDLLDNAHSFLEQININEDNINIDISLKTKFEILEVLELKEKIMNNDCLNGSYSNLSASPMNYNSLINPLNAFRKNSEARTRRKSSINPKDVEYIKRSRFNSKADELKIHKDNPNLVDEVVQYLNMDIEFYQCFQLNEEECYIVKEYCDKFLQYDIDDNNINNKNNLLEKNFEEMMEELQCEKFIAMGHLIEIMFSQNEMNAKKIINIILYLFKKALINDDDIKHGIVLGLVKFKKNIIDYPNTKKYFQNFIDNIKTNKVLDEKILIVYQRCCDSMGKNFE
jgi:hypothetical protein